MADQWVQLTSSSEDEDKGTKFYANLRHAISVWPNGDGSTIWYHASGEMSGCYDVEESPEQIIQKRDGR